jgi:hypothetical protein
MVQGGVKSKIILSKNTLLCHADEGIISYR